MIIRCKLMDPRAIIPRQASGDSGADLYSTVTITVPYGRSAKVDTGVAFEIPDGMTGLVLPRSGLASRGLMAVTGVIDPSYRGAVAVTLVNTSESAMIVRQGDRIAQIVFVSTPVVELDAVAELSDTSRGPNGFGSTGR